MERIEGVVRTYHWGDPDFIPSLRGQDADGTPHAELWFGAHPSSPSPLGSGETLEAAVQRDPQGTIGAAAGPFPFLAKVLAAAEPLSIQVHPDELEARRGFAREEADGIPVDAPDRTYRDPLPKPELVCALTTFEAKCGLRDPDRSVELLDDLRGGDRSGDVADQAGLAELRDRLAADGAPQDRLRDAVTWLFGLPVDRAAALVEQAVRLSTAAPGGAWAAEREWTCRLADHYPGDVGVVVALLLNHVRLEPGQGLHLGAGHLHSYLRGAAVEVMAPSDNVLRGGLTSKHVDVDGLLEILDPTPLDPQVQTPAARVHRYQVPGGWFGLTRIERTADDPPQALIGPGVVLVTAGRLAVDGLGLTPAEAALVRADDGRVALTGEGTAHWVHQPRAPRSA